MWTELEESSAAGHSESVAEEHFSGEHEGSPRAHCWDCQQEAGE